MGIIGFLILGLIAGALAKLILPGKQGGGIVITLVLGVIGALLGGFIGSAIFGRGITEFDFGSIALAVVGSIIVLLIYGAVTNRNRTRA